MGYTKQSVEKAKLFVQVCLGVLGSSPYLWIAFQSNVLYDLTYTTDEFSQCFKEMVRVSRLLDTMRPLCGGMAAITSIDKHFASSYTISFDGFPDKVSVIS